jgi:formylglycine-generating enzyme required for sulfatase activity
MNPTRRLFSNMAAVAALVLACGWMTSVPAVTIDVVTVGDPGNANDNSTGNLYGGVSYAYQIGQYEVTNAQYAEFLNAKAASDPLALYNANMGSDARGGITQSGSSGNFTYATRTDMGNKPVNFVSWYDAIRFANWMNNGQGAADTENGAYTIEGGTPTPSNGDSITRNVGATWFLTSENEWYKGAYYEPGASSNDYWLYPTASDADPTVATANATGDISNPGPNVANYFSGADWNSQNGNVTTVGSAGASSASFYGTSDQGGNVFEWNEALISGSLRGLRGGAFNSGALGAFELQSSLRGDDDPTFEFFTIGFRVATVPEPSTAVLCIAGCVGAWTLRRRFRSNGTTGCGGS